MYIATKEISIDIDKSLKYNEIFVRGGSFEGINISGRVSDSIINIPCSKNGYLNMNVYLDLKRRSFIVQEKPIDAFLSENDLVHIGGVIMTCNERYKHIIEFIGREDECLQYKRGFDESFGIDLFDKQELINTCTSNNKEFTTSFNTDYNINEKGDGIILDCRVDGNITLANGSTDLYDGNRCNL